MKNFECKNCDNGIEIRLSEQVKTLFRRSNHPLKVSEWNNLSNIHQIEAVGFLSLEAGLSGKDCYELEDQTGYFISFSLISKLSETQALALNLPRSCPFQIRITTSNNIGSENFKIDWILYGKHRQLDSKKSGCFITVGADLYRLPLEFLNITNCIEAYNRKPSHSFDEKTAFIAELKSMLPNSPNSEINFDGELEIISLQHVAAFSLQITGDKNSLNFNPVLFNKLSKRQSVEKDEPLDEDEQILSEDEARNFSASFKKTEDIKASYIVGTSNYVFIDKSLRPALSVVKKAMSWPKNERMEFAKTPQKFIKEALGNNSEDFTDVEIEIIAQETDSLFIETRQFSNRVTEMGIWEAPELPWLTSEPNDWRADNYSFLIQGKMVSVPVADLKEVVETVTEAIKTQASICEIGGVGISPDKYVLELLEKLLPMKPNTPLPPDDGEAAPDDIEPVGAPMVLLTKDNFNTVEYNSRFAPLTNPITAELPSCLNPKTQLKSHQEIGLEWLVGAYNRGLPGVLMADDMGLGKTLQALTFLAILVESGKTDKGEPILIVAPVGLLKNWQEEHDMHLSDPGLGTFAKVYGNSIKEFKTKKGRDIEIGSASLDTDQLKKCDWLLTTYETLRDYQASFGQIKFCCVVFDELQKAKNPRSLISHSTKILNTDFALGLTGTPVENSLSDLWTIMDILSPGRLKDLKTFMDDYPDLNSGDPEAGLEKLRSLAKQLLEPAPNSQAPILRRMKVDLKDVSLPNKIMIPSSQTTRSMPAIQDEAYTNISNKLNSGQASMLEALHQFKTISLHPISPEQSEQFSADDYINKSARLIMTFEILDEIKERSEKVLIFTENRKLQPLLASLIRDRYQMPSMPLIINGMVSGEARQTRVNIFQESDTAFDVMIISPKAGGVGLTLTAANNIIHLERWWNPAVEDQCTDRAYRIGQEKDVKVYLPLAKNNAFGEKSFDCVLDGLLNKKRELSKGLFIPTAIENDELTGALKEVNTPKDLSLDEIDCIEEGKNFEHYVIKQIRKFDLKVHSTPRSYDRGADVIVENKKSNKSAIIQCKHLSSADKRVSDSAVLEAINAKEAYTKLKDPLLIVVTNTHSVTKQCRTKSEMESVVLILRDQLLEVGAVVDSLLRRR